jgi:hypothetical protein
MRFFHLAAAAVAGVLLLPASASAAAGPAIGCDASLRARDRILDSRSGSVLLELQLLRPTNPASAFAYQVPEASPVCSTHFCVHYVETGADAPSLEDLDQNASPDSVDALLETLEVAREMLIGLGHDSHGVSDHAQGGDERMDVYLALVPGMHGLAVPETLESESPPRMSSFMIVNSPLTLAPLSTLAKAVVAHELKHTFDFATFAAAPAWLFESSATWVEDQMVDETTSYSDFFPCWFLFPELSLDSTRSDAYPPAKKDTASCVFDNTHIYGSATFWFYVASRWGTGVQGKVWDRAGAECAGFTPLDDSVALRACVAKALDGVLGDAGESLAEAYADFSAEVFRPRESSLLLAEEEPAELEQWPEQAYAEQHDEYPVSAHYTLKHLSTRYVELRAPTGRKGRARIEVRTSQPDRTRARVSLFRSDGTRDALPIQLDSSGRGHVSVTELASETNRAVLMLSNVGSLADTEASDGLEVDYEVSFEDLGKGDFIGSSGETPTASDAPDAGGCSLAARGAPSRGEALPWLLGVVALLRRRRIRARLSSPRALPTCSSLGR